MTSGAICDNTSAHSFTKMYQSHRIKDGRYGAYLPFTISDSMGLEGGNEGMQRQDLTKSLKGFIKDGYMLDKDESCSEKDAGFNHSPTLDDQIHCLVSIIPATSAKMIDQDIFEKMRHVRCKATEMKIPQVALLTKVDNCSEEVKKDIQSVYKSKKIKAQMEVCSNRLGVPMNFIFPVKNYHEEIDLDNDIDVLLLSALTRILNIANDHVDQLPQDTHT
ncbi:interferon-induced protein 44-like [Engraulis encrasicolus]|uniref:interferon-induced protein 44-like n=1 Tax=Engraulis encrasicolus TaxID=184585 RepID=UPI002FD489C6